MLYTPLFLSRAVKHPFRESLSQQWRVRVVSFIYILSIATSVPIAANTKYIFIDAHAKYVCHVDFQNPFYYTTALGLVASYLPLTIIIFLQILSWKTLRRSMRKVSLLKMNQKRAKRIKEASYTYVAIVIAFFLLTLPKAVNYMHFMYWYRYQRPPKERPSVNRWNWWDATHVLYVFNSCVNPLLYAKIHKRMCTGRSSGTVKATTNIQMSPVCRKVALANTSSVVTMNTCV